ncbi:serum response factor protein B [Trifolium repens]|nr:serum response factor protein B [Trifolium repens]
MLCCRELLVYGLMTSKKEKIQKKIKNKEEKEQEVAMSLIMLGRDVRPWCGINSIAEFSYNNNHDDNDDNSLELESPLTHLVYKTEEKRRVISNGKITKMFTIELIDHSIAQFDLHNGYVYVLDIHKDALDKTSLLLEESLNSNEKQHVKLFNICHSKMEEVVQRNASGSTDVVTIAPSCSILMCCVVDLDQQSSISCALVSNFDRRFSAVGYVSAVATC